MPLKGDWHRRPLSSILRPNEGYDIAWLLHGETNTEILMPYHGFNCMGNISRVSWWKKGIGHFRITFGLFFKASAGANPFIWKLDHWFVCLNEQLIRFVCLNGRYLLFVCLNGRFESTKIAHGNKIIHRWFTTELTRRILIWSPKISCSDLNRPLRNQESRQH